MLNISAGALNEFPKCRDFVKKIFKQKGNYFNRDLVYTVKTTRGVGG